MNQVRTLLLPALTEVHNMRCYVTQLPTPGTTWCFVEQDRNTLMRKLFLQPTACKDVKKVIPLQILLENVFLFFLFASFHLTTSLDILMCRREEFCLAYSDISWKKIKKWKIKWELPVSEKLNIISSKFQNNHWYCHLYEKFSII